jgi:hypothetical protein
VPSWFADAFSSLTAQERAVYLASIAAVVLAWAIARRRSEHRPAAILLSVGLASDVIRRALYFGALAPAYLRFGQAPFEGWARVAGNLDQALFLLWPAALVALARVGFGRASARRSLAQVAAAWATAAAALVIAYPLTRGAVLARCYLAVEIAALLAVAVTIGAWVRERRSPELHHVAVALAATAELCTLGGPWRINLFGSWPLAQTVYFTLFVVLLVLQGGSLWLSRGW